MIEISDYETIEINSAIVYGADVTVVAALIPDLGAYRTYLITCTEWTHIRVSSDGSDATTADALLAPGERLMYLGDDRQVSVLQLAGGNAGIIRIAPVRVFK